MYEDKHDKDGFREVFLQVQKKLGDKIYTTPEDEIDKMVHMEYLAKILVDIFVFTRCELGGHKWKICIECKKTL